MPKWTSVSSILQIPQALSFFKAKLFKIKKFFSHKNRVSHVRRFVFLYLIAEGIYLRRRSQLPKAAGEAGLRLDDDERSEEEEKRSV